MTYKIDPKYMKNIKTITFPQDFELNSDLCLYLSYLYITQLFKLGAKLKILIQETSLQVHSMLHYKVTAFLIAAKSLS